MDQGPTLFLKERILDHICQQSDAYFKSQQINDPELTLLEKQEICRNLLDESHTKFLHRYGKYLTIDQLEYFVSNPHPCDDEYETKYLQDRLKLSLDQRGIVVKNRRYMALKNLIDHGEYFSEKEMMRREPLLYDQLVGQYLTDQEIYERDRLDENNFSSCLFEGIDNARTRELRTTQQNNETVNQISSLGDCLEPATDAFAANEDVVPKSYRTHWGGFDDGNSADLTVTRNNFTSESKLTQMERNILQQEFVGIMQSNFLSGLDPEVNYNKIDNDESLDDLMTAERDSQEKYFDEDEGDGIDEIGHQDF